MDNLVLIAGGGIGGLATALTLHQIGVPCMVFEAVREMRPLGVGINLQPNAVRELYDLGISEADLDAVGLPAKEWALVGLNGNDIYSEPRGRLRRLSLAAVRGASRPFPHGCCTDKAVERIGERAVRLGSRVTGYRKEPQGGVTVLIEHADGAPVGDSRRAAHRRRRHPFGGAGPDASRPAADPLGRRRHVARHDPGEADPHRRLLRRARHRPPPHRLLSDLAARSRDRPRHDQLDRRSDHGQRRGLEADAAGSARSRIDDFVHHFDDWVWDWLDVPALIRGATAPSRTR